jgi:hypothetical protein
MTRDDVAGKARRWLGWLDTPTATRVLQVVAVISLGLGLVVGAQTAQLTRCQADYAEASNANSRERTAAAEADRKAIDDMVKAIAGAKAGPDIRVALENYLRTRAENDKKRAANPLPKPPSTECG